MNKLLSVTNPLYLMMWTFVAFLALALLLRGGGLSDSSKILLTVTSFVFGFYINSLIAQSRSRHTKVLETLREEGGYIKGLYFMTCGVFPKSIVDKERAAIDKYLIATMDYKVVDYASSAGEFRELFDHIMKIQPESKQQDAVWGSLVKTVGEISKNRNRVETLVKERVSSFEWLTVLTLLALVIFFVYSLDNGTLLSILVTSFIATALTMLIIILHGLDSLQWKEDKYFWEPLEELFLGLDLLPYYPKILVDKGRLQLKKGHTVRLVDYPNLYPDMTDKIITIHK